MLGCRELWGDAPAGEQQSRLDVSPLGVVAQRFPSPKVTAATPCSAEWELREDEQRLGGKKVLSPEGGRFRMWAVAGRFLSHPCQQKWWRRRCCVRAGSQAQGDGRWCCSPVCEGRGSLETALTSQSGAVAL